MAEQEMLSPDEVLDEISRNLSLESWFEGKTLTVVVDDEDGATKLVKLRLVGIADKPSSADLRGEPA